MTEHDTLLDGVSFPQFAPCAPGCAACILERIGDVERALRGQIDDPVGPKLLAIRIVLGTAAQA